MEPSGRRFKAGDLGLSDSDAAAVTEFSALLAALATGDLLTAKARRNDLLRREILVIPPPRWGQGGGGR